MGYISTSHLKYLVSTRALGNLKTQDIYDCCSCKLEKFYSLPFNRSVYSSFVPFDLVYYDVWGFSLIFTKERSWYYGFFF